LHLPDRASGSAPSSSRSSRPRRRSSGACGTGRAAEQPQVPPRAAACEQARAHRRRPLLNRHASAHARGSGHPGGPLRRAGRGLELVLRRQCRVRPEPGGPNDRQCAARGNDTSDSLRPACKRAATRIAVRVFKTCAVVQPTARSVRLRRRSVKPDSAPGRGSRRAVSDVRPPGRCRSRPPGAASQGGGLWRECGAVEGCWGRSVERTSSESTLAHATIS